MEDAKNILEIIDKLRAAVVKFIASKQTVHNENETLKEQLKTAEETIGRDRIEINEMKKKLEKLTNEQTTKQEFHRWLNKHHPLISSHHKTTNVHARTIDRNKIEMNEIKQKVEKLTAERKTKQKVITELQHKLSTARDSDYWLNADIFAVSPVVQQTSSTSSQTHKRPRDDSSESVEELSDEYIVRNSPTLFVARRGDILSVVIAPTQPNVSPNGESGRVGVVEGMDDTRVDLNLLEGSGDGGQRSSSNVVATQQLDNVDQVANIEGANNQSNEPIAGPSSQTHGSQIPVAKKSRKTDDGASRTNESAEGVSEGSRHQPDMLRNHLMQHHQQQQHGNPHRGSHTRGGPLNRGSRGRPSRRPYR